MLLRSTALAASVLAIALAACGQANDGRQVNIAVSGDEVTVSGSKITTPTTAAQAQAQADAQTIADAQVASAPASADVTADDQPAPPQSDSPKSDSSKPVVSEAVAPGHVSLGRLTGNVDPEKDAAFARIPAKYIAGQRVWGQKDAVEAFGRMAEAAKVNGYQLKIVSAFRSFDDQKKIWEDKWTGVTLVEKGKLPKTIPDPNKRARKILEYSSMPGTSRHHWGTDFDFNSLDNKYFNTKDGKRIYDWLVQHAGEFGFCQPYTAKGEGGRPSGYEEEKWHWSYKPVASWYLKQYPDDVGYERLKGFLGSEAAKGIDVIPNYVQAIDPECK
jgi:zinc D-Ala-D-Ala carboxypeptidase